MIRAAQLCLALLIVPSCLAAQDASFRGIGVGMSIDSLKIVLTQLKKTDYWSWPGDDKIFEQFRTGAVEIQINTLSSNFGCVEYAPDDKTCLPIDFLNVQLVNGAVSSIWVGGANVNVGNESLTRIFDTYWRLFREKFGTPSWTVDLKSKKRLRAVNEAIRREQTVDLGRWSLGNGNFVEFYIYGEEHGTAVSPWLWIHNTALDRKYDSVREQQRLHPNVKPEF